jgi:sRNA-binding regulator protein Hfq
MTGMTGKIADVVRSSKVAPKVKVSPKGHEAFLKALEASGAPVTFEKVSSGEKITGSIKHSDKYTISVLCDNATRVLFKHDISEFQASFPDRKPSAEV